MPVLKFCGNNAGFFAGSFVFFAMRRRFFVKFGNFVNVIRMFARKTIGLGIVKIRPVGVQILNFGNNHSHRRPPVTEMNVGNHLVADKFFNPANGFADNGRTQMPDMHQFGHIRAAGINNNILRLAHFGTAKTLIGGNLVHVAGNKLVFERNVDKARAVDRDFFNVIVLLKLCGNFLGDFAWIFTFALRQSQSPVALKIAQIGTVRVLNGGKFLIKSQLVKNSFKFFVNNVFHGQIHLFSSS